MDIIRGINESIKLILMKHILCKCQYNFDDSKCNLNQRWNDHKCLCECNM